MRNNIFTIFCDVNTNHIVLYFVLFYIEIIFITVTNKKQKKL